MEFQFHGANCISINTRKSRIVVDDNLSELGLKSVSKADDILIYTVVPKSTPKDSRLIISDPGEYEASEISVFGIQARAHTDEKDEASATMYKIQYDDLRVGIVGHIHPDISEEQIEELGAVDMLFIPVGGNGYTLDGVGALSVIKKFDPKIIIPTHYADDGVNYPVPQQTIEEALKTLSMEPRSEMSKFKPKASDFLDGSGLIILNR